MNKLILNIDIQNFINNNLNSDITELILKGTNINGVETKEIAEQIEAKKRCKSKLPTWFETECIYYPNKLNIEQTSSEITAEYKSDLISGNSLIDLTGGFGVDCFYFSKQFKKVIHCEINDNLSKIAYHNYNKLGIQNIETRNTDGIAHLNDSNQKYDWIYIDPSRRHNTKGKVFFLKDCIPNVTEHITLLHEHTKNIMIKTSPLLDISIGVKELKNVKSIHIIAVKNDVKELLWILESNYNNSIEINTININKNRDERFSFFYRDETQSDVLFSTPLTYLYEPNASLLKSGGFNSISNKLNVFKLHQNSHLYTFDKLIEFPGRRFKIENVLPYNRKMLRKMLSGKANIVTRNFPKTVESIRKDLKIKDGGNTFLFFTTVKNGQHLVLICKKVNLASY